MTNDEKFDQIKDHLELLSAQIGVLIARASEEDAEDLEELEEDEDEEEEGHEWDIVYFDADDEERLLSYEPGDSTDTENWWSCGKTHVRAAMVSGVVMIGAYSDDNFEVPSFPIEVYQAIADLFVGNE